VKLDLGSRIFLVHPNVMKIKICLLLLLLLSSQAYAQDFIKDFFSLNNQDLIFRILYEREGPGNMFSKKKYNELENIIPGQIDFQPNGEHILKLFFNDRIQKITIKALITNKPQIATNGKLVNSMMTEECIDESSGESIGLGFINYEGEDVCHLILVNNKTDYVHEFIIKLGF